MFSLAKPRLGIRLPLLCLGLFAFLVFWAMLFPYTGDGDSVLHYLNARDAVSSPVSALHAWARPGVKLLMAPFAMHGILATRAGMALITVIVAWQTIRVAGELRIPHPLLAGPMLLWQSMVFALASDTMTEMPMALGVILAIRLWINGWRKSSALLVGFLPMFRPEGFFLGVLWGVMVLAASESGRTWKSGHGWRIVTLALMTVGLLTWAAACWALTDNHDPLYVLHIWNWPPGSYAAYGTGPLLHHVLRWPQYCGEPLTVLFILGILPSARRRGMGLPWAVWLLVFGVHTILYWRGWFASCGLMRIFGCTSPVTALICLHGWNWIADKFAAREPAARRISLRAAGILGALICTIGALGQYVLDTAHYDCFPIVRCSNYIRENHLLGPETHFFTGNQIATAALDFPPHPVCVMDTPCNGEEIRKNLIDLPIGSIGVWDNRQAAVWHSHRIEDLAGHGFSILYDTTIIAPMWQSLWRGTKGTVALRYVVLRKDGPFDELMVPKH